MRSSGAIAILLAMGCTTPPAGMQMGEGCEGYRRMDAIVMLFDDTVTGADPSTFECLANEYGKDRVHIFFGARMMPGIDVASFEVLEHGYSRDKDHVYYDYYSGATIPDADPETFKVFDLDMTKDGNAVYYWEDLDTIRKLDSADATTFDRFGMFYRDRHHVFDAAGGVFACAGEYTEAELRDLCLVDSARAR